MHAQHVDMVLNTQDERRGICTGRVRGLFPLLLPFITDVFSGVSYASTLRYAFSNLQRGMHTAVSSVLSAGWQNGVRYAAALGGVLFLGDFLSI